MKVSLVVATGVHQGKAIALPGPLFVIGRDPDCHLRPASPAVSKKHCQVHVRDGRVFVMDLGSTNGTFVNDAQLAEEVEVAAGDRLRVGPLDFRVQFVAPDSKTDSTPLPESLQSLPRGGKLSDTVGLKPATPGTPMPRAAAKPTPGTNQPVAAPKPTAPATAIPKAGSKPAGGGSADDIAAAMMAEDDDSSPYVPDGSTVMELPSLDAERLRMAGQDPSKAAAATPAAASKKPMSSEDSSNAASEILRKYMKRTK